VYTLIFARFASMPRAQCSVKDLISDNKTKWDSIKLKISLKKKTNKQTNKQIFINKQTTKQQKHDFIHHSIGHQGDWLKEVPNDEWLEDIQLELSVAASNRHCGLVAD
jgi:hypothetical protein